MAKLTVHGIGNCLLVTKRGRLIADAEECKTLRDLFCDVVAAGDTLEFTESATLHLKNLFAEVNK